MPVLKPLRRRLLYCVKVFILKGYSLYVALVPPSALLCANIADGVGEIVDTDES